MKVGQCKYVILTNQKGGILNDPVLLKLDDDRYWFSLADSDVLFWAQGLAHHSRLDVEIVEPDVSPLQLQGPKSRIIMSELFDEDFSDLKYYWFKKTKLGDIDLIVSRTGWSSELGYELFLLNHKQGDELYERIMKQGKSLGLHPGHTSTIRRIEGAMLSYHADMDIHTNPFELGLDRLIELDKKFDFVGKEALQRIKKEGLSRLQVGLILEGAPLPQPNTRFWDLSHDGVTVGKVTSAVYSPRLKKNIALAMVSQTFTKIGTELTVDTNKGIRKCSVVKKPFYDPKKSLAVS